MRCLLALLLLAHLDGYARAQPLDCPRLLQVHGNATVPNGWRLIQAPEPNTLERVGFYSGPPEEQASLAPDDTRTRDDVAKDVWKFPASPTEEIWQACFYTGTSLMIARPLGKTVRRCEVSYKVTRSGSRLSVMSTRCS